MPSHVHVHGPVPDNAEALPELHKPAAGADPAGVPSAGPHVPLTICGAEQLSLLPPPDPLHVQENVFPANVTPPSEPALHRPEVGVDKVGAPAAGPHDPFIGPPKTGAEQFASVPPAEPKQVHVHGPVPPTADSIPVAHKLLDGAEPVGVPFAVPQDPFVKTQALAEHNGADGP